MPQVGPLEILVIFVIALVVFGPKEIPRLARQAARAWREVQRFQATVRRDIDDVLREVDAEVDAEDDTEDDTAREDRGNRPPRLAPKPAELEAGAPADPDASPDAVAEDNVPGAAGPADPTP